MKRSTRAELARETIAIVEQGSYRVASGVSVEIGDAIRTCLDMTRLYLPEDIKRLRRDVLSRPSDDWTTVMEVTNETTLAGASRLHSFGPVAVLNFASAKNPGGGFLNGSEAQEESLARSSALYASQIRAWGFYERHRGSSSLLYSDAMIVSPGCPIFRDDEGILLKETRLATFITSAAPNAGAALKSRRDELPLIPDVFLRRAEYVLALAVAAGCRQLVLGAWGCGVFRNDPAVVAEAFAGHLRGSWAGRFERVVFSVLDTSADGTLIRIFEDALG